MDEQEKMKLDRPDKIVMVDDERGVEEHLYLYIYTKSMMLGTDKLSVSHILDDISDYIDCWNGKDDNGKIVKYIRFEKKPDDYDRYVSIED